MTTVDNILTLSKDIRTAAATLELDEARYLVDTYYQIQEFRKATINQSRALTSGKPEEPHATLDFFGDQFMTLEKQIKSVLDVYSANDTLGQWARANIGIGPVIAAGLLANIDISRVSTAGQIWAFAGLSPTQKWEKGQKRPWNARLKVLCWKASDSFVKQSGRPNCFYGHIYRDRKEYEILRNNDGGNAKTAKETLETKNIRDKPTRALLERGLLPDGQLDARARRYAVKLFLAHYFEEGWRQLHSTEPPLPYPVAHLGHAHVIKSPV